MPSCRSPVVIACHPVSLLALSSCSRCLVVPYLLACLASLRDIVSAPSSPPVVSRLIRLILFSLACLRVVIAPRPLVSVPPPVFSCGFLSFFSPFLRRAGRGGLLLASPYVAALVPSSRFPHSLRSSRAPCLLALRGDRPPSSSFPSSSSPSPLLVSRRRPSLPFLPVFRQVWAGRGSARCCLLIASLSFSPVAFLVVLAACGVGGGRACCLACRCRRRVVFGL